MQNRFINDIKQLKFFSEEKLIFLRFSFILLGDSALKH